MFVRAPTFDRWRPHLLSLHQMNGGDSMTGGSDNGVEDSKVHELELQMSKLFVQLQEAHTKNDAQEDLIEGMKAANAKLVASLKKMKHKLKEATDSGVNHMFHDMTRKCMRAEAEKAAVEATLAAAQSEIATSKANAEALSAQLKAANEQITVLQDDVKARGAAQLAMENQLLKQQHYIKDLEVDFKTMGRVDVDNPEMEHAQRTLAAKTEQLMELERKCKIYEREIAGLRQKKIQSGGPTDEASPQRRPLSLIDLDHIHTQTLKIESKADTVSRMVTMYASGDPPPPVEQLQALLLDLEDEEGVVSCDSLASDQEGKQRILMSLMQSQAILDGVAHHLAQGCARFLGSNCALQ
ncbi:hypothetical protein, variant 1 [Aphanomyces astaci]|uniref:Uncharacterized protein n=1 Tax=Aphanomyces astaci TaxID=112090 RepID=W4GSU8_APHAT|nr:hypothetical protein, variant 1 [Aphanomyces astaci]ETV82782.1 hypothetical protein, variant 1 [Aphanomyces astaci]|eukprot:XP_009827453.1 hypothetical protein, variant 1 [Aphanomyces astaci]